MKATRKHRREVIEALRAEVDDHLQPGMPAMKCRICRRTVFLGKHKIDSAMARALVRMYRFHQRYGDEWMDYRNYRARGESRKHSLLRHWDLVERADRKTGPSAGFWRITELGRDFIDGEVEVPAAAWLYNDTCYGFVKRKTTIRQALGNKFDLDELLRSEAEPSTEFTGDTKKKGK